VSNINYVEVVVVGDVTPCS